MNKQVKTNPAQMELDFTEPKVTAYVVILVEGGSHDLSTEKTIQKVFFSKEMANRYIQDNAGLCKNEFVKLVLEKHTVFQ